MMESNTDRSEKNDDEVEENYNLGHAQNLWAGLCASESQPQLRVTHLWRIIFVAYAARTSPILSNKKEMHCADVLSLSYAPGRLGALAGGFTTGASSKVRTKMRKNRYERELKDTPEAYRSYKSLKEVWAPQGDLPRMSMLREVIEEEFKERGQSMPDEPDSKHRYESCAEPMVYQNMCQRRNTPEFTYSVQKSQGNKNSQLDVFKYVIKVVKRCENCMLAGNHLGQVITDHEELVGLQVPIVTPRVMRFFREMTETEQAFEHDDVHVFLQMRHFDDLKCWSDKKLLLPTFGPGGTRFDEEMAMAIAERKRRRNTVGGTRFDEDTKAGPRHEEIGIAIAERKRNIIPNWHFSFSEVLQSVVRVSSNLF